MVYCVRARDIYVRTLTRTHTHAHSHTRTQSRRIQTLICTTTVHPIVCGSCASCTYGRLSDNKRAWNKFNYTHSHSQDNSRLSIRARHPSLPTPTESCVPLLSISFTVAPSASQTNRIRLNSFLDSCVFLQCALRFILSDLRISNFLLLLNAKERGRGRERNANNETEFIEWLAYGTRTRNIHCLLSTPIMCFHLGTCNSLCELRKEI